MYTVEKARIADVVPMQQLINSFADRGEMLPRPLSELYENIRDFWVVREGDKLLGCGGLHIAWSDLAEVKSLAVALDYQKKNIGSLLVKACLQDAHSLGLETVFCLTYKPGFFKTLAFEEVDKMTLPRKVWTECFRCPKFPDCDETALVYKVPRSE